MRGKVGANVGDDARAEPGRRVRCVNASTGYPMETHKQIETFTQINELNKNELEKTLKENRNKLFKSRKKRIHPLKTKEIINNLKGLKRFINSIYPRKCCKKFIIIKNIPQE